MKASTGHFAGSREKSSGQDSIPSSGSGGSTRSPAPSGSARRKRLFGGSGGGNGGRSPEVRTHFLLNARRIRKKRLSCPGEPFGFLPSLNLDPLSDRTATFRFHRGIMATPYPPGDLWLRHGSVGGPIYAKRRAAVPDLPLSPDDPGCLRSQHGPPGGVACGRSR